MSVRGGGVVDWTDKLQQPEVWNGWWVLDEQGKFCVGFLDVYPTERESEGLEALALDLAKRRAR